MTQSATDSSLPQRTKVIEVPEWWGREKEADSRQSTADSKTIKHAGEFCWLSAVGFLALQGFPASISACLMAPSDGVCGKGVLPS